MFFEQAARATGAFAVGLGSVEEASSVGAQNGSN